MKKNKTFIQTLTTSKQMENFSDIIVRNEETISVPAIDIKNSNLAEESMHNNSSIALFESMATLQNDLSTDRFQTSTPLFNAEMEA